MYSGGTPSPPPAHLTFETPRFRTNTCVSVHLHKPPAVMPRTFNNTVDYDEDEPRQFVKNDKLAELTGRSKSWISDAARNDYLCEGMPLAEWAVKDRYGQIRGFDIPETILEGLRRSQGLNNR